MKRKTTFTTETGRFVIDAVWSPSAHPDYVTVECQNCTWIGEADVPVDLYELNRQASEHGGMCTGAKE